jgi:hypothetical protein
MDDINHCWQRLRNLTDHAPIDPREQATEIVRSFTAQAGQDEIDRFKARVFDELAAKTLAQVSLSDLEKHSRWLAVLNAAKGTL